MWEMRAKVVKYITETGYEMGKKRDSPQERDGDGDGELGCNGDAGPRLCACATP